MPGQLLAGGPTHRHCHERGIAGVTQLARALVGGPRCCAAWRASSWQSPRSRQDSPGYRHFFRTRRRRLLSAGGGRNTLLSGARLIGGGRRFLGVSNRAPSEAPRADAVSGRDTPGICIVLRVRATCESKGTEDLLGDRLCRCLGSGFRLALHRDLRLQHGLRRADP